MPKLHGWFAVNIPILRGRLGGGWKNVSRQAQGQYAPTKIAHIFRLASFSPQFPYHPGAKVSFHL